MKKNSFWFYIVTFSVFFILISPTFLSQGMFFDGTIYSTIAKNFALNNWSFWIPHYTTTFNNVFYGHPPLSMWLHSKFLVLFGNYLIVDKIFSVLTIILTSFVISLISKIEGLKFNWLPIILWFTSPLVFWAATNNVLENLLSFFVALSMLFFVLSNKKHSFFMLIMSGLAIFAGLLTKGFVALFVLSAPFFYFLFDRNRKFWKFFKQTSIMLFFSVFPATILYFFNHQAQNFIDNYLKVQFLGSFNVITAHSRFDIIIDAISNLFPFIIISILLFLVKRLKKFETKIEWNKALVYLFVALSGTLPIMITLKQSQIYLIPAMVFYSLFFAFIFEGYLNRLTLRVVYVKYLSILLLTTSIVSNIYFSNKIGRDKDLLLQVNQLIEVMPSDSTISVPYSVYSNWSVNAYLARYKNISLDATQEANHKYLLWDKNFKIDSLHYKIILETKDYIFLEKIVRNKTN